MHQLDHRAAVWGDKASQKAKAPWHSNGGVVLQAQAFQRLTPFSKNFPSPPVASVFHFSKPGIIVVSMLYINPNGKRPVAMI